MQPRALLFIAMLFLLPASSSAQSGPPSDKTLIFTWPGIDFPHYLYIAPNGHGFWRYTAPDIGKLGVASGGDEFVIGRTIRTEDRAVKGSKRVVTATANWSDGKLALKSTSQVTFDGDSIKIKPNSNNMAFEISNDSCKAISVGYQTSTSCKIVDGNQLPR